jgi:predicted TPR repeat methyltransferase
MGKKNRNPKTIGASKVKKASKARSLTKELMDKAVRHIASEIVASKPELDARTPRGYAEKLLKEVKESFPKLTMNKVNYDVKLLIEELKKGALSLNTASKISSLTGEEENIDVESIASSGSSNTTTTTANSSNS